MFKVTVWGESHGPSIGAVVEGCPPGVELDMNLLQEELNRRRPGKDSFVSSRQEKDRFEVLSGLFKGKTTGTPISVIFKNDGSKKENYEELGVVFRPGHADFTYQAKYGIRDYYGGGRSSARLTAPIVFAGALASQILRNELGIEILAYVKQIGSIESAVKTGEVTLNSLADSLINFPDKEREAEILALLKGLQEEGNSIGGIVECTLRNTPAGLGEPLFGKLDADLAAAIMGLNAVKGFELGNGFECVELTGKENNDEFTVIEGDTVTITNRSGGILGGISNGMPIVFRVAFKAAPSISQKQRTVDIQGKKREIQIRGDHDICVAIRAVPVVEALAAIVILDHYLRYRGQCGVIRK
ncbi:MAG: chorismate synthase [Candidatus Fermentibacteria bacterium]|nr:chorismate synthase [Candidatus Fermentibacteria bacterium]